jgi:hypothetical protein
MTEKYNDYLALNGEELLEVILRKGRPLLAAYNQHFGRHLAYHNPFIRLAVKVECFTPEGTPDAGGFELSLNIAGPIFEPDKIREELGLGTYQTKLVDEYSGTLADVRINVKMDPSETLKKVEKLLGEQKDDTLVDEATEAKRAKWRKAYAKRKAAKKKSAGRRTLQPKGSAA